MGPKKITVSNCLKKNPFLGLLLCAIWISLIDSVKKDIHYYTKAIGYHSHCRKLSWKHKCEYIIERMYVVHRERGTCANINSTKVNLIKSVRATPAAGHATWARDDEWPHTFPLGNTLLFFGHTNR